MAKTIYIPGHAKVVGSGGTITYTGTAEKAVWWELVGVDSGIEGAAYGSLANTQSRTDVDGRATANYTAPATDPGADKSDRIRVYE